MIIHPVEYIIDLSTGEDLQIAEFDPNRIPEMNNPDVMCASSDILDRCTKASREILEEAKHGYDSRLKPLLRTPPVGALLKFPFPLCSERLSCSMYDKTRCSTKNIFRQGGAFPECWEAEIDPLIKFSTTIIVASRALRTAIVHSWRQGMYSIIVLN